MRLAPALLISLLLVITGACSVAPRQGQGPVPAHGAVDPSVTQWNIQQTICVSDYTSRVGPPTSYTNRIKIQLMVKARIEPSHANELELDHIIPLGLGGDPWAIENLQLQPWEGSEGAQRKDRIEVKLQCLVCSGQVRLVDAQREIADDWQAAYHQYASVKCQRSRQGPLSVLHYPTPMSVRASPHPALNHHQPWARSAWAGNPARAPL
jgi:hypothetical protein